MTTETRYRITGDIIIKPKILVNGRHRDRKVDVSYANGSRTNLDDVAIIQARQPLTPHTPYFLLQIQKCDPNAILSIGIAPIDIDRHTGLYNNSLGYHNDTGRIYTSWRAHANTLGVQYGEGHTVAIYVTYFGKRLSTVLIYYNNFPIATRYHFEENIEQFLPTITFSGGHVDVSVLWPDAVEQLPSITDILVSQWIRAPMCSYDSITGIFENRSKAEDLPIQSPTPLCKSFPYFVVVQEEVSSTDGKGASVGLATCSPLKPTPTCSLMKDYYTWFAKMRMKVGNMIGWGIYYDENCQDDKAEQLCLVFVMFNKVIVDTLFVLQPEGGFVPIVLLQPYAKKVSIERRDILTNDQINKLQQMYRQKLGPATEIYRKDKEERELSEDSFRKSDQVLLDINDYSCRVSVPRSENSIHYIQLCQPLTTERRFFFVELINIPKLCQVTVGIASSEHELNEAPGMDYDTVGYNSYTGKLYSNRKDTGNMHGHPCQKGDTMGVAIEVFDDNMSVVLFSKNFRPIGTRYLTLNDQSQYFPTILIECNGDPVELLVYWQTRVSVPPTYSVRNPEDWCLPADTKVDLKEKMFIFPEHFDHSLCIQAPYSLNKKYNHFEIILLEPFTDADPPPAIALCTASPLNPPPTSQFKQDYLRFWPTGDAAKYLKQGDKVGWGIFFPEAEDGLIGPNREQLIICYLTINRIVGYVRVLYQPIGGFYPVVIAPPNVNRIQMDFTATRISTDDFTPEQVKTILADARQQIEIEDPIPNSIQFLQPMSKYDIATTHEVPTDITPAVAYDYQNDPAAYYGYQTDPTAYYDYQNDPAAYYDYQNDPAAYYDYQHDPNVSDNHHDNSTVSYNHHDDSTDPPVKSSACTIL